MQTSAILALGGHTARLRMVDRVGQPASDTAVIAVVDTRPPIGGIVGPAPTACIGLANLPVRVEDDFTDVCGQAIARSWSPGPGPTYDTHGDHTVTVTATDASGNAAQSSIAFSIDRVTPEVSIVSPAMSGIVLPDNYPLHLVFNASDDDGAAGGVVLEQIVIRDRTGDCSCVAYDGRTYGDRDGLLSDESILIDQAEMCRLASRCGFNVLDGAEIRIEAADCAGNVGFATRRVPGGQLLFPGVCGS